MVLILLIINIINITIDYKTFFQLKSHGLLSNKMEVHLLPLGKQKQGPCIDLINHSFTLHGINRGQGVNYLFNI